MAHLYVINPARKLRLLTTLFYRGSRRILGIVDAKSLPSNTSKNANSTSMFKAALGEILIRECEPIQDEVYYKHSDAGYCVFQVENTLFKVILFFCINSECGPHLSPSKLHRVLLTREHSAFYDMFSLAQPDDADGTGIYTPQAVFLSDAVQQFRDFLWALYASSVHRLVHLDNC
jgi:hypothetical protein